MQRTTRLVKSVSDWVLTQLAARRFEKGAHLNAHRIAQQLSVSPTTARAAIAMLVDAGWASRGPSGRIVVNALPPRRKPRGRAFTPDENHVDIARRSLREKVLRGELRVGESINAKRLSEELKVSLPAVRQALEGLAHLGIVQRLPRRGWRVAHLTAREVRDICCLRVRLEPLALKSAVRRLTDEQIDGLWSETEAMHRRRAPSRYEIRRADYRFHHALLQASHRPVIASTLDPLIQKLFLQPPIRDHRLTFSEHLTVLEALRRRDIEEAAARLRRHLRGSGNQYVRCAADASRSDMQESAMQIT